MAGHVHHPELLEHSAPERNYEPWLLTAMIVIFAVMLACIGVLMIIS